MRIVFTGAHSTGKSTLVREVASCAESRGLRTFVIDGIARAVLARGIPVNRDSTLETYLAILSTYLDRELAISGDLAILDRFLADHAAYAKVHGNCPAELLSIMRSCHELLSERYGYDRVFYLPVAFPITADGSRDPDPNYQRAISEAILYILNDWQQPYVELKGTIDQRVNAVLSSLQWES